MAIAQETRRDERGDLCCPNVKCVCNILLPHKISKNAFKQYDWCIMTTKCRNSLGKGVCHVVCDCRVPTRAGLYVCNGLFVDRQALWMDPTIHADCFASVSAAVPSPFCGISVVFAGITIQIVRSISLLFGT